MKSLRKFLKDLKKTYIWKFFIQYFFYPFYNFFWQFILNFKAKILYILWSIKKRDFINLSKKNTVVITDNKIFKDLANKISNETNLLRENSETYILSEEYKKKLNDEIGSYSSDTEMPYRISLYEDLSDNLKRELVKFASSEMMISTAAKHMGIFPILTRVQVYHNIPRQNAKRRGAMHWHRDTFGFKNLDFFMAVTDVDDENGPFYYLEKKIKASVFLTFRNLVSTTKKGERGKVPPEEFSKHFKDNETSKFAGKSGSVIFTDTFSVYHRGGFCKSKDRVLLRLCYQSHDAAYDSQLSDLNTYKFDQDLKKNEINDIFKKYLFFKKKSKFMSIMSEKILNFYRKLDFII
jgi:hypothetical protein